MSEIDLPSFPFPHDHLTPSPAYAERRASCPLGRVRLPSGHAAVLLVTHRDIAAALADTRLSHNVTAPGSPRSTTQPSFFNDPRSMNAMDGEPHLRIRRIVASAVNELLRHNVLGPGASLRIATEDLELPSGPIAAGEVVAIVGVSGQHDEQVHPEPQRLRFNRTAPAELAFGGGPHYCLGAHLAKAELQIGLRLLIERFPKLRLTVDRADLRFTDGEILSSLIELPVSW